MPQGFAIGSAALVSLALYGAFVIRLRVKTGVPWSRRRVLLAEETQERLRAFLTFPHEALPLLCLFPPKNSY